MLQNLKKKPILVFMLVILGLLIIAGSILSESNTDRPTPTTAPYTSTSETPIPASVWTTSKLAEGCVITIKNIELMSDCEQALALAFFKTAAAVGALPADEKREIGPLMEDMSDLLDKFTETTDDAVIGPQEIDFICFAEPQWSVRIQNARQWLGGRDPTE